MERLEKQNIHQQNVARMGSVQYEQSLTLTEERLISAIQFLRNRLNQIDDKLTEINTKLDTLLSR